jgi:rod shape-determining protein MreB
VAGLPKTVTITSEEIREALQEPLRAILEVAKISLERTPPELSADLIEHGIVMAGAGSLLKGIDKLISEETGLPVHIADDPLTAVARGTGKALDNIKYLREVTVPVKSEMQTV